MNPPVRSSRARPYMLLPVRVFRLRSCRPRVRRRLSCLQHLSGGGRGHGGRPALHSQMPTSSRDSSKRKASEDRARSLAATAFRDAQAETCPQLRLQFRHAGRMRSPDLQISGKHPVSVRNFLLASRQPYQLTDAFSRQVQNASARLLRSL